MAFVEPKLGCKLKLIYNSIYRDTIEDLRGRYKVLNFDDFFDSLILFSNSSVYGQMVNCSHTNSG